MEGGGQNKESAVLRTGEGWTSRLDGRRSGGSPEGETKTEGPLDQEGKGFNYMSCHVNCPLQKDKKDKTNPSFAGPHFC